MLTWGGWGGEHISFPNAANGPEPPDSHITLRGIILRKGKKDEGTVSPDGRQPKPEVNIWAPEATNKRFSSKKGSLLPPSSPLLGDQKCSPGFPEGSTRNSRRFATPWLCSPESWTTEGSGPLLIGFQPLFEGMCQSRHRGNGGPGTEPPSHPQMGFFRGHGTQQATPS